jgi:Cytochrome C oxidase, cbb3-type, subunit III
VALRSIEKAACIATGRRWQPAELFWIVRNGVKMTAMPSFAKHLSDQEIWGVVGFIQRLPGMPDVEYARLMQEADHPNQTPGAINEPAGAPNR